MWRCVTLCGSVWQCVTQLRNAVTLCDSWCNGWCDAMWSWSQKSRELICWDEPTHSVTPRVTQRHGVFRSVTKCHAVSHSVTYSWKLIFQKIMFFYFFNQRPYILKIAIRQRYTKSHARSHDVTRRHTASHNVTQRHTARSVWRKRFF